MIPTPEAELRRGSQEPRLGRSRTSSATSNDAASLQTSWLKTFLAVADSDGFNAATIPLHLSLSRVSAHVAALEQVLGVVLFDRKARPTSTTEAGEAFREHAVAAMNELQRGVEAARGRMNDWPIRARIGVHPIVSSSFVANVLRELQTHHPGFAVELIEGTSARLEEMLTSGDADLALQPAHSRSPAASLSYRSIWSEQVVAVMKDHDDLADRPSVTFDDLSKRTLVFGAPGVSGNKGSPDQRSATARSNNELGGSLFTEQPATLIALVHSDFGIGIINCLALETTRLDGLAVLPIGSGSSRREMAWYWLEARSGAPSVRALLDCVVSVAPPTGAAAIG